MTFNLERLQAAESEALAYTEGFPGAARLYARIDDLQRALGVSVADLHDMTLDRDMYLAALVAIYDGVNAGTLTTGGCMVIAGRVIP